MMYEVSWTRALAAMIGSSTYAFSIMLVTFLIGIAIGSSLVSCWRPAANLRVLGVLQLGIALGGIVFLIGYLLAPYALMSLIRALYYSFPAILFIQFVLCAGLMVIATICMGATLPVASQLYSTKIMLLGRTIGSIYSVNTLGAIAGSLLAGFLLIPLIGTERTILAGLFLNAAMALLLLTSQQQFSVHARVIRYRRLLPAAALILLLVATISMRGGFFWNADSLDRGVLVYSHQFDTRPELKLSEHYEDTDVVYFKEGNNASISVRKGENYLGLRTNGKVDASSQGDMITQLAFGYLPGLYHPHPKSALVIGYGSGVTVGAAATNSELEQIDCVEIEPAVVGAGSWFSAINRRSYENPKVKFVFDDARNYMNVSGKQYDIIISEPSNPWIAGVASLFTAEFYDRAAQVLKDDGVFAQWVQLYELDPEDLRMVLKEFQRRFPEVSVWVTDSDLVMIGTRHPQTLDLGKLIRLAKSDPSVQRDLRDHLHLTHPEGLPAYYVMSTDAVRKFASTKRRNTDDHPVLEFDAPRQLFTDTKDLNVDLLYDAKDGLLPPGILADNLQTVYAGMIEPLLSMKRANLANQSMALLGQIKQGDKVSVPLSIARLNLDSNNLQRAEQALREADAAMEAGNPLAGEKEELWGTFYDALGDTSEAKQHFESSVRSEPTRPVPLRRLAEISANDKSWHEAANWMQQYIATQPQALGQSWAALGDYRIAAKEFDEGLHALQTALEIDPYVYGAHFQLARLFERRNETENAVREYEFLVKYAFDRDPDVYVSLAGLYKKSGRLRDADRVLAKGTRILPTNADIYRLYRDIRGEN